MTFLARLFRSPEPPAAPTPVPDYDANIAARWRD